MKFKISIKNKKEREIPDLNNIGRAEPDNGGSAAKLSVEFSVGNCDWSSTACPEAFCFSMKIISKP
jgi:hypothetical protein